VNEVHRRLGGEVDDESDRLMRLVDELSEGLAVAEEEHRLVEDWPETRLQLLRSALQQPRFADVSGYRAEVERAEAELAVVQELRRRLAGEHT